MLSKGALSEKLALEFLKSNGFIVIERNYRRSHKELDILAIKGAVLHLIEVKSSLSGVEDFQKRNINSYLESLEFEAMSLDISIDLIIVNKGKIFFYENVSGDIVI